MRRGGQKFPNNVRPKNDIEELSKKKTGGAMQGNNRPNHRGATMQQENVAVLDSSLNLFCIFTARRRMRFMHGKQGEPRESARRQASRIMGSGPGCPPSPFSSCPASP